MNLRFILTFLLFITLGHANAYKVLFLAPFHGKSHFLFMQSFVRALLNRGHSVTYLTSNSLNHLQLANYTEYLIDPVFDFESIIPPEVLFNDGSPFGNIDDLRSFPEAWNKHNLESASVQRLINSTNLHFDVIINEEFFGDSLLMFAHKFNYAPTVTICPLGHPLFIDLQNGLLPALSVTSHIFLPYSDEMTFSQRWYNVIVSVYDWYVRKYGYLTTEEEYAQKYFGHLGPLPSLTDLIRNVSLVLVNTHRAIFPPRATLPNVIGIGGAHIKPPKPLPKDIQIFLDEAKHGAIFFSLGTIVQASKLPKEKLQAFLDTFKALKQRVLWKFEDETLPNIPPNVMIKKWLPQNDVLAHKNVILFIGHGGLFGTSEALYHGRPLLLIPFFADQHRNSRRIEMTGYGKFLPFAEVNRESFFTKINEIISDDTFMARAKQTSAIFQDNLVHPMDEAIFWIEHVGKFKGAEHLKSHAVHMSWFSYLLLDVIAVNLLGVSIALYGTYYLLKKLFARRHSSHNGKKRQ